jgi:hypothetical protein
LATDQHTSSDPQLELLCASRLAKLMCRDEEFAVDDVTVAATPLNVTVFWLGVELNPVP